MPDLISANSKGSVMVVHAHAENGQKIVDYVPRFPKIIGTTYVQPRPDVYNYGGYSDGDRALFLAMALGASPIVLAGMDMGENVGKYSKTPTRLKEVKKVKLKLCKEILEWGAKTHKEKIYNITTGGEKLKGFVKIHPENIGDVLKK